MTAPQAMRGFVTASLIAALFAISPARATNLFHPVDLTSIDCDGAAMRDDCRRYILAQARVTKPRSATRRSAASCYILAQARVTKPRVSTAFVRRNAAIVLQVTVDAVAESVQRVGVSARSVAAGLRNRVRRRFVISVCCKDRVEANTIADDLARRFPGARIERNVQIRREDEVADESSQGAGLSIGDIVDFVVFDRDGPKLVFKGCAEPEADRGRPENPANEQRYIVVDSARLRLDLGRAEMVQACLDLDTGEVSYKVMMRVSAPMISGTASSSA